MALLVEPHMHGFFSEQLDSMFRLRHRILVERLGWTDMIKPDGRDIDQYDHDKTIYLLTFGDSGEVIGCSRLNPSLGPNLATHSFGDKATLRPIPKGPDVLEYSRFCVDFENYDRTRCNAIKADQVTSVVDYCVRRGFNKLITFTLTHTLPQYVEAGVQVNPLGLPVEMDGTSYTSVEIMVAPNGVELHLNLFGLMKSPLIDPALAKDDELANFAWSPSDKKSGRH